MNRRRLLGTGFGLSVYGFTELLWGQDSQDPKDAPTVERTGKDVAQDPRPLSLRRALADMKTTNRGGLVFVVPERAEEKRALGQDLFELVEQAPSFSTISRLQASGGQETQAEWRRQAKDLTATLVFVALTPSQARAVYPDAFAKFEQPRGVLLLGIEGEVLAQHARFTSLRRLTKCFREKALPALAASARRRIDLMVRALLESSLASVAKGELDAEATLQASAELRPLGRRGAACILHRAMTETRPDVAKRLRAFLHVIAAKKVTRRLPYGTKMPVWFHAGCGHFEELPAGTPKPDFGHAIECGAAMPTKAGRRFLRFSK